MVRVKSVAYVHTNPTSPSLQGCSIQYRDVVVPKSTLLHPNGRAQGLSGCQHEIKKYSAANQGVMLLPPSLLLGL